MAVEIKDLLSSEIGIHIDDLDIPVLKGDKGEKGDKPIVGVDYYTEIEKNEFKNAIVKDSKEDIQKHAANKIEEYDNNATERIKEYNTNASNKINEYDENANKLLNKLLGAEAEIKKDIEKKVDKIEGKELSSNDFTDGYKQKLDNLENYDDTQIKKYISDIEEEQIIKDTEQDCKILELQNKKTEIEKELKEMQEDFYQNSIRGQSSGEYIHVEDSSNCRAKIKISGNSEQETRSGKNILENSDNNVSQYGLTATIQNDGSVKISGTSTAETTKYLTNIKKVSVDLIKEGNYTISFKNSKNMNDVSIRLRKYNGTDKTEIKNIYLNAINKSEVLNLKSLIDTDTIEIELDVICYGNREYNFVLYPQLELGSETEYEQYGESPSLDYRSEIKCSGDNVNLFDGLVSENNKRISTDTGGTYTANGFSVSQYIEIEKSNYIINTNYPSYYACYDIDKKYIAGGEFRSNLPIKIINSNTKYMRFDFKTDEKNSIKLEKGSIATPYSKHGQGCVKVTKCNKNLFNKNDIVNKAYINSSGEIVSNDGQNYTNYISVVSNAMYTIHAENPLGAATAICFYDTNKKFLSGTAYNNVKSMSFKTTTTCKFVRVSVSNINLETLQIEEGPATTYEEHEEQSDIMPTQQAFKSIGDMRDTFIKKDDKWYERHNINRKKLDSTENWMLIDNNSRFAIKITEQKAKIDVKDSNNNLTDCLSNRFMSSTQLNIAKVDNGIAFSQWSDTQYLYLSKIKDSVDELKKYLAENETYVDYPLETPIDIECTEEQSKILDELNNARTYKNVTNITTDSKAIIDLDYVKDLETLLNNVQALALSNASEGV